MKKYNHNICLFESSTHAHFAQRKYCKESAFWYIKSAGRKQQQQQQLSFKEYILGHPLLGKDVPKMLQHLTKQDQTYYSFINPQSALL